MQEVYSGSLESNGEGLLGAVEDLLAHVFVPALSQSDDWGDLTGPEAQVVKSNFLRKLSSYVAVLTNARASIADAESLSPCGCTHPSLLTIRAPADVLAAAANPELVEAAETCCVVWCKEIQVILTKSEQIRKEPYNVGPQAELEHWKKRMAKFDSLTTSLKSPLCKVVINILVAAKSKVLQVSLFVSCSLHVS